MEKNKKNITLIFDDTVTRLLQPLLRNTAKKATQSDIIKITKLSKVTVMKFLRTLVDNDLIKHEEVGRTVLFSANTENSVLKQIKILFSLFGLYETAKQIAKELECEVYLYGSAARGEDTEKSDIDLLIIGDKVPRNAIMSKIAPLEIKLGKKISFQIFTKLEWAKTSKKDKPFYERVEKDRIRLA